jgi:type I restriction enzyme S subunit
MSTVEKSNKVVSGLRSDHFDFPRQWQKRTLSDIGSFSKGKGIRKNEVVENGLPCVRYGEIYTHHKEYLKSFNSWITENVAKTSQPISTGDLLFAGSGETADEIGKCVAYGRIESAYAGGDIIIFSPKGQDSLFLGYLMSHPMVVSQKAKMGQGDAIVHIGARHLSKIEVLLPPLPEQAAIARVLSDTDALIENLEKLIAKKKNIKQGVMQQLLTGKRRLPGFTGEWERAALGVLATVNKGVAVPQELMLQYGSVPYLNGGIEPSGYISQSNTQSMSIAISEGGNSCGYVQFMKETFWCGGHCYSVIPKDILNRFLYYSLKYRQPSIMRLRVGSGLPNVQKFALKKIELNFPSDYREQEAIAILLEQCDQEVELLENQRNKFIAIKQGMMQTLLTGKIRLPLDKYADAQ